MKRGARGWTVDRARGRRSRARMALPGAVPARKRACGPGRSRGRGVKRGFTWCRPSSMISRQAGSSGSGERGPQPSQAEARTKREGAPGIRAVQGCSLREVDCKRRREAPSSRHRRKAGVRGVAGRSRQPTTGSGVGRWRQGCERRTAGTIRERECAAHPTSKGFAPARKGVESAEGVLVHARHRSKPMLPAADLASRRSRGQVKARPRSERKQELELLS